MELENGEINDEDETQEEFHPGNSHHSRGGFDRFGGREARPRRPYNPQYEFRSYPGDDRPVRPPRSYNVGPYPVKPPYHDQPDYHHRDRGYEREYFPPSYSNKYPRPPPSGYRDFRADYDYDSRDRYSGRDFDYSRDPYREYSPREPRYSPREPRAPHYPPRDSYTASEAHYPYQEQIYMNSDNYYQSRKPHAGPELEFTRGPPGLAHPDASTSSDRIAPNRRSTSPAFSANSKESVSGQHVTRESSTSQQGPGTSFNDHEYSARVQNTQSNPVEAEYSQRESSYTIIPQQRHDPSRRPGYEGREQSYATREIQIPPRDRIYSPRDSYRERTPYGRPIVYQNRVELDHKQVFTPPPQKDLEKSEVPIVPDQKQPDLSIHNVIQDPLVLELERQRAEEIRLEVELEKIRFESQRVQLDVDKYSHIYEATVAVLEQEQEQ